MKQHGFTIIELIIAIFVLSVGLVGIFSAFSMMVVLTANASDRFTAAYLAQEGIEVIRNIRDNNWLESSVAPETDWLDGLDNCDTGCQVDYKTMGTASSPVSPYGNGSYLYIDSDGFYSYTINGQKTKFKRKILMAPLSGYDYIAKATVTVFWDEKPNLLNPTGVSGSFIVEEYFYDWY